VSVLSIIRDCLDALLHPSARYDALTRARHRAFMAPRLLGSLAAFAAFPVYLAMRGAPTAIEVAAFAWLIAPILLSWFLSRTGRYDGAHILSSLALAGFIMMVAVATGGIGSFVAVWLIVIPLEAALSASRRVVSFAFALAMSCAALLVVLGHTIVEGGSTNLYIGKKSGLARFRISASELRVDGSPRPLVLLIACATAALGDAFGSLPGALTAKGAGAVVGTLSKIVGSHGALATAHLLRAIHEIAARDATVGEAVEAARRSLIADQRPIGLILVSHGEMDTKVRV